MNQQESTRQGYNAVQPPETNPYPQDNPYVQAPQPFQAGPAQPLGQPAQFAAGQMAPAVPTTPHEQKWADSTCVNATLGQRLGAYLIDSVIVTIAQIIASSTSSLACSVSRIPVTKRQPRCSSVITDAMSSTVSCLSRSFQS